MSEMTVLDLINYLETLDETLPVVVFESGWGYEAANESRFYVNESFPRLEIS